MKKILLIPGLLCDEKLWQPLLQHIRNQYNFINIDIAHGSSIEKLAAEIAKEKDAILIGFSLGARIALHAYSLAPENFQALILISSAPGELTDSTKQHFLSYIEKISTGKFEEYLQADFKQDISEKNKSNLILKENLLSMMRRLGPDIALKQLNMLLQFKGNFSNLNYVTCPTLLIQGEDDKSINQNRLIQIHKEISRSLLIKITDAAHYIPLENPLELANAIDEWLEYHI